MIENSLYFISFITHPDAIGPKLKIKHLWPYDSRRMMKGMKYNHFPGVSFFSQGELNRDPHYAVNEPGVCQKGATPPITRAKKWF